MKYTASSFALLGGLALLPIDALACAGCRNPNMPVTRIEAVQLRPGELRASASLGITNLSISHEAGCADLNDCSENPVQPLHLHEQDILPGELRAIGELGLTTQLGVELQVPFRIVHTTVEYATPDGQPYQPLDVGIHHRDETLAGFGDPWLLGRWAGEHRGLLISVRAGLSIPIARTEPNPFVLGDLGQRHQHIQFGSGTWDPILALDLSKSVGLWLLSAHAQGQASLYENSHGFRAGARVTGGAQMGRRVWRSLTGALGVEALYEGPESWDGQIQQDGSLGRSEALLTFSLVQPLGSATVGMAARTPVYRHIITGDEPPGTLSSPLMLGFFASRTFSSM